MINFNSKKKLISIVNINFIIFIILSFLFLIFSFYKFYFPPEPVTSLFYITCISIGVIGIIFFIYGIFFFEKNVKINLSIIIYTFIITIYVIELLFVYSEKNVRITLAEKYNINFDKRTRLEVLEDLSKKENNVFPNFFPRIFILNNGINTKTGKIFPFGSISNSKTILYNEAGFFPIIDTDEKGFSNPRGLYDNVEILIVGDSFVEGGYGVNVENSISGILRANEFNTITLGKSGNGPLIEYATLREYAQFLKPKIVLWMYYYDDLDNLNLELKSNILQQYLNDKNFSQNLFNRQNEIDYAFKDYIKKNYRINKNLNSKFFKILTLNKTRKLFNAKPQPKIEELKIRDFKKIISLSEKLISSWGGKLYFVYLPSFNKYFYNKDDVNRNFVIEFINDKNISIIDIQADVFDLHEDPLSLFPFRISGHYNANGYKKISEHIMKIINNDLN
tara:strand:- start:149 stop:1495 length:1347 start_codon:yes stop_codon:yes gene_type:complete